MKFICSTFFCLLFTFSLTAQDYSKSVITTTGDAIVYAAPDEVRLTLGIVTTSTKITDAKAKNNTISTKTIQYLKAQGVAAQHIQTQYLSVSKLYRTKMVNKEEHSFQASQTIHICIKDLNKYTSIADGLLELGVTSVSSPNFRNTNIRKFKDEARVKAIKAAKEKADLLAGTLGQKVAEAYQIREIEWARSGNQNAYSTNPAPSSSEPEGELSFAPGQLEVRAKIEVCFSLKL